MPTVPQTLEHMHILGDYFAFCTIGILHFVRIISLSKLTPQLHIELQMKQSVKQQKKIYDATHMIDVRAIARSFYCSLTFADAALSMHVTLLNKSTPLPK